MTDAPRPWLDWPAFQLACETANDLVPRAFDAALKPLAADPLATLLQEARPAVRHLTPARSGTGLRVSLGEHREGDLVLWQAGSGLSPISTHWGVKGLVNIWGATFREGLNLWLETLNGQLGGQLRQALRGAEQRQRFLDALLELPTQFHPQLSVGADVSARPELQRGFPEVHARKQPHLNPFKDTDIRLENRLLLAKLLELYATQAGKQTLLTVKLFLPPDDLGRPTEELLPVVRDMVEALDHLAGAWSAVSLSAVPVESADTNPEEPKMSGTAQELLSLTPFTRNIILYGPPGTGKTYAVQAFQQRFLRSPVPPSTPAPDLAHLYRWQVVALTLYHAGADEALSVTTMFDHQPLARYEALQSSKSAYTTVLNELADRGVDGDGQPVSAKSQRSPAIFLKRPNKTWSLSEQGRQYVEATLLTESRADWNAAPEGRAAFITFHPSFAYEEFVEGLRPQADEDGQLSYEVRDGVFKRVCWDAELELHEAKAAGRNPRPFLLVIDEINRANIAKVFGELMTLIEDDKRVTADGQGLQVTLPYSGQRFGVPENLYLIGTMNTADRSIALLDLALRRRFTFLEVLPDPEVVRQTSGEGGVVDGVDVAALLAALNTQLRVMLDRDHQLGHSYLTGITQGLNELQFRWYRKVIPLLQEYFYNDGEKLQQVLGQAFVTLGPRLVGPGGRCTYDIQVLQGDPFRQALRHLTAWGRTPDRMAPEEGPEE